MYQKYKRQMEADGVDVGKPPSGRGLVPGDPGPHPPSRPCWEPLKSLLESHCQSLSPQPQRPSRPGLHRPPTLRRQCQGPACRPNSGLSGFSAPGRHAAPRGALPPGPGRHPELAPEPHVGRPGGRGARPGLKRPTCQPGQALLDHLLLGTPVHARVEATRTAQHLGPQTLPQGASGTSPQLQD